MKAARSWSQPSSYFNICQRGKLVILCPYRMADFPRFLAALKKRKPKLNEFDTPPFLAKAKDREAFREQTEAARLALKIAFRDLNFYRIEAAAEARNKASVKVAKRAGLIFEGKRAKFFTRAELIWSCSLPTRLISRSKRKRRGEAQIDELCRRRANSARHIWR